MHALDQETVQREGAASMVGTGAPDTTTSLFKGK
eukprot:gene48435-36377_t